MTHVSELEVIAEEISEVGYEIWYWKIGAHVRIVRVQKI